VLEESSATKGAISHSHHQSSSTGSTGGPELKFLHQGMLEDLLLPPVTVRSNDCKNFSGIHRGAGLSPLQGVKRCLADLSGAGGLRWAALPVFRGKVPHSLTLRREGLEDESQGYNSTKLILLFRAAPSPSAPAHAVPSHPASCWQTQRGTCTQPLPSQATATTAHWCASRTGWAPAPRHGQRPLPLGRGSALPSPSLHQPLSLTWLLLLPSP